MGYFLQQIGCPGVAEALLKRWRWLEVRRDTLLSRSGYDDYFLDTALHCFLDDILKHGAVQYGQEFLGDRLGHRQETGSHTGRGDDCFFDGHDQPPAISARPV